MRIRPQRLASGAALVLMAVCGPAAAQGDQRIAALAPILAAARQQSLL
jgi:hypothetical protein